MCMYMIDTSTLSLKYPFPPKTQRLESLLIYHSTPVFTGPEFVQKYFFPSNWQIEPQRGKGGAKPERL